MGKSNKNQTLVIGNGESRKSINLNLFIDDYFSIGCNAIHRDLKVDYLICCDRRMAEEATNNSLSSDSKIFVREDWFNYFKKIKKNKNIVKLPELFYKGTAKYDQFRHWGSGSYAVLLAAQQFNKNIFLLGFDLYSVNGRVNNIYKDTNNYKNSTADPVDYSFWIIQLGKIFKFYQDKNFYIINNSSWTMPNDWLLKNVNFKTIDDFLVDNKYRCSTIVP